MYRRQAQDQPENALSSDRAAPAAAEPEGKGWLPPGGSVQVKTSDQGIRYASGGVGESEREELRAMSDQFNVRVMSAMPVSYTHLDVYKRQVQTDEIAS